jgi:threonine/homoserine/homoserine lactone efflux protein
VIAVALLPAAYALGFALGAAPGPVQVLILSETAKRGFAGGLRVMLGANLTILGVLVVLALGVAALAPADATLRFLRIAGGIAIAWIGVAELRSLREETSVVQPRPRRLGPTSLGVVSVILNPGAWIFLATTASAVLAGAANVGGRDAAVLAAVAMAAGVSSSDIVFAALGSGGRRIIGDRGLRWVRGALAALLLAIGAGFVWQGLAA